MLWNNHEVVSHLVTEAIKSRSLTSLALFTHSEGIHDKKETAACSCYFLSGRYRLLNH